MYTLQQHGVTVIPILNAAKLKEQQLRFIRALDRMPEYINAQLRRAANENAFVVGGFSALANPASFHNMCVRNLRSMLHPHAAAVFKREGMWTEGGGRNIEQIIDRESIILNV